MKTIMVTGAAGALGQTVVQYLLEHGYRVIALARKSLPDLGSIERKNLVAMNLDLADEAAAMAAVSEAVKLYGKVDGALLLAGGFSGGSISETGGEQVSSQLRLNFETAFHIARPLFLHMMEQGRGRLVFIGAQGAMNPTRAKNMLAYALSKSMLLNLTEVLNEAARGTEVMASVVVPGTIDTRANRDAMPGADTSKWIKPIELAGFLEFLLSDEGSRLKEPVLRVGNG